MMMSFPVKKAKTDLKLFRDSKEVNLEKTFVAIKAEIKRIRDEEMSRIAKMYIKETMQSKISIIPIMEILSALVGILCIVYFINRRTK